MKPLFKLILTFFIMLVVGCRSQYAALRILIVDDKSGRELTNARVYTGEGQFIGYSEGLFYDFEKKSLGNRMALFVLAEASCYKTGWQLVNITKWAKNSASARNALMLNQVLLRLSPDTCINEQK